MSQSYAGPHPLRYLFTYSSKTLYPVRKPISFITFQMNFFSAFLIRRSSFRGVDAFAMLLSVLIQVVFRLSVNGYSKVKRMPGRADGPAPCLLSPL